MWWKKAIKEFLESVRQGCAILRGEAEPSRLFHVDGSLDIKQMHKQTACRNESLHEHWGLACGRYKIGSKAGGFPKDQPGFS